MHRYVRCILFIAREDAVLSCLNRLRARGRGDIICKIILTEMKYMAKVTIAADTCKGCGLCVRACPKNVLKLSETETNKSGYFIAEVVNDDCIGCASCAVMCPDVAITVER